MRYPTVTCLNYASCLSRVLSHGHVRKIENKLSRKLYVCVRNSISLLDRSKWTHNVCSLCGKLEPKHSTLDCPLYEQCSRCKGTGVFSYRDSHTCYVLKYKHHPMEDINDCDYNLYWNGRD